MAGAMLRHTAWILRGNPLTGIAAAGVILLVLISIFGPSIVPYDPIASNVSQALLPPSAAHLAGTDQLGRDTFSRLIVATRLDLAIAVSAVGISFVLGAVIGAFCGYAGGRLDRSVGRSGAFAARYRRDHPGCAALCRSARLHRLAREQSPCGGHLGSRCLVRPHRRPGAR